jgi:hypothetical protein
MTAACFSLFAKLGTIEALFEKGMDRHAPCGRPRLGGFHPVIERLPIFCAEAHVTPIVAHAFVQKDAEPLRAVAPGPL